ncbi:hypothetical protein PDQ34_22860 [Bacillus cereus]|nr:hypothetical protein [Bacillus cereus]MDA2571902.1 hypothetical protein [Bacillus cereus]
MKKKKIIFKVSSATLALSIGFTTLAPASSAFAAEKNNNISAVSNIEYNFNFDRNELYELGVSDLEINNLINNTGKTGIILKNGVAYGANGNILEVKERGKLSWAVKAIRAVWNKIPTKVKVAIGGLAGFQKLLGYIDHFTGSVEDAVYNGLRYIGCSPSVAWWAMKIITAIAF